MTVLSIASVGRKSDSDRLEIIGVVVACWLVMVADQVLLRSLDLCCAQIPHPRSETKPFSFGHVTGPGSSLLRPILKLFISLNGERTTEWTVINV